MLLWPTPQQFHTMVYISHTQGLNWFEQDLESQKKFNSSYLLKMIARQISLRFEHTALAKWLLITWQRNFLLGKGFVTGFQENLAFSLALHFVGVFKSSELSNPQKCQRNWPASSWALLQAPLRCSGLLWTWTRTHTQICFRIWINSNSKAHP